MSTTLPLDTRVASSHRRRTGPTAIDTVAEAISPFHHARCSSTITQCLPHLSTRSKFWPLTLPPPSDARTLRLKPSRFNLRSSAASLFSGSDAFGSRKRNCVLLAFQLTHGPSKRVRTCRPTTTAFKFKTGFQSSRRIFRHTFPSRSIFGW